MKMPYYPYFFILKCHLRIKIQIFFLARFHSKINFYVHQWACRLTPQNLRLNLKVSLLSQALSCSFNLNFFYFKQLVVMSFIFGKAILSLLFYTDNPYLFQFFIPTFSLIFCWWALESLLVLLSQLLSFLLTVNFLISNNSLWWFF